MRLVNDICFGSAAINRQALQRSDNDWVLLQQADKASQFLLFWDNKFLTTEDSRVHFLDKITAEKLSHHEIQWKLMGELDANTIFAAEITEVSEQTEQLHWQSLRALALQIPAQQANLLAYTQGLLNWHAANNFCSCCGASVEQKQAGHALFCSNNDCAKEIFPRTDPAVIVLIHHQDACLLGRGKNWPHKVYSCLAGFVETGESLDAAVRREIFEESGLLLGNVIFRGSQPWPFPQSLMLGFHAEAMSRELTFHDDELLDARWYNRQQLLDAIANEELILPSSLSISYHLIEAWFNQQYPTSLSQCLQH